MPLTPLTDKISRLFSSLKQKGSETKATAEVVKEQPLRAELFSVDQLQKHAQKAKKYEALYEREKKMQELIGWFCLLWHLSAPDLLCRVYVSVHALMSLTHPPD